MSIINFPNKDPRLLEEILTEYERLRSVEMALDSLACMAYEADGPCIANVLRLVAGELTSCTDTFSGIVERLQKR